ncbi:MAG TPA: hypothetical protein VLY04_13100 [Bryobacteraceae bacterium]|nr:hypothetical protein [Bryobacteraceae bacterium]
MERTTKTDRACAVAAAAAHDLNNELTVILNSASRLLGAFNMDEPGYALLLDLQAAAQRCAWKASGLLHFGARGVPRPIRASFENLIEQ